MTYLPEKAKIRDAAGIKKLIDFYVKKEQVLPRSLSNIYENIRDFFVYKKGEKVIGCCALHIAWNDMAEVRSLIVNSRYSNKGIGSVLLSECLKEANSLEIKRIFTLTYVPTFFKKNGFKKIPKESLPHKIWSDCVNCPKFPDCDEIAMDLFID